jgi:hypothetical protein
MEPRAIVYASTVLPVARNSLPFHAEANGADVPLETSTLSRAASSW